MDTMFRLFGSIVLAIGLWMLSLPPESTDDPIILLADRIMPGFFLGVGLMLFIMSYCNDFNRRHIGQ